MSYRRDGDADRQEQIKIVKLSTRQRLGIHGPLRSRPKFEFHYRWFKYNTIDISYSQRDSVMFHHLN